jgi:hypothetical protein
MSPPTLERNGHTLAARYEALREYVLGSAVCRHTADGLALLMREGMAPWMESVAKEPMRDAAVQTAPRPMQIPDGIERNLIQIVANMAFVAALENVT